MLEYEAKALQDELIGRADLGFFESKIKLIVSYLCTIVIRYKDDVIDDVFLGVRDEKTGIVCFAGASFCRNQHKSSQEGFEDWF